MHIEFITNITNKQLLGLAISLTCAAIIVDTIYLHIHAGSPCPQAQARAISLNAPLVERPREKAAHRVHHKENLRKRRMRE
jgi:hypothetical protein